MKLFELVDYLDEHRIQIQSVDGKLRITGDTEKLTPAAVESIKTHKQEISAHYSVTPHVRFPISAPGNLFPLSAAQRRIYFLCQYDPETTIFNLPIELGMEGPLNLLAFRSAFEAVVATHKILKTVFVETDGIVNQRHVPDRGSEFEYHDLSDSSHEAQQVFLEDKRRQIANSRFDLHADLPLRACLVKHAHDNHSLFLLFHHIATDEWSIRQFMLDFIALYSGKPPREKSAASYFDYALWQNAYKASSGVRGRPVLLEHPSCWSTQRLGAAARSPQAGSTDVCRRNSEAPNPIGTSGTSCRICACVRRF
jgi:hypothetical protein